MKEAQLLERSSDILSKPPLLSLQKLALDMRFAFGGSLFIVAVYSIDFRRTT
jgi:hypothetical protein